ncbi:peptide-methionine (S)-S-oxide reductase [Luteibacter sp. Sphag1AF]|uniref:peptide-methionine (S)-S-oxide reductase MsrA n=1 Tax=Luteibacter sp. Sphag1AF TaxID=2587031 RepID=UPI001615241E|nr:peptide-methionine (S)-S-oxide reductase MsrA [Luteibacter sp. Sphag1AF]MBB3225471.1 peptide-methionine (S)-S-oxide reductase [Luteibacter sp. Sphag1AF]
MFRRPFFVALAAFSLTACTSAFARDDGIRLPDPATDAAPASGEQIAVLAGGCFWGVEGVFEHVRGVKHVTAGYTGGDARHANYEDVSEGDTGHAESVRIVYDPAVVSYGQLLKVYFSVAQDPTLLNEQGPDHGTQYRSAIFYATPEQKRVAEAYIAQLGTAHAFSAPIVTAVTPLTAFYPAEDYHQNYMRLNPDSMYIRINDLPKVLALQRIYPQQYTATWANAR